MKKVEVSLKREIVQKLCYYSLRQKKNSGTAMFKNKEGVVASEIKGVGSGIKGV